MRKEEVLRRKIESWQRSNVMEQPLMIRKRYKQPCTTVCQGFSEVVVVIVASVPAARKDWGTEAWRKLHEHYD